MSIEEKALWGATSLIPRIRHTFVVAGAAGDHTVTGISAVDGDLILEVSPVDGSIDGAVFAVEFSISAANTINNDGGTAVPAGGALVVWFDHDWTELSGGPWVQ